MPPDSGVFLRRRTRDRIRYDMAARRGKPHLYFQEGRWFATGTVIVPPPWGREAIRWVQHRNHEPKGSGPIGF